MKIAFYSPYHYIIRDCNQQEKAHEAKKLIARSDRRNTRNSCRHSYTKQPKVVRLTQCSNTSRRWDSIFLLHSINHYNNKLLVQCHSSTFLMQRSVQCCTYNVYDNREQTIIDLNPQQHQQIIRGQ